MSRPTVRGRDGRAWVSPSEKDSILGATECFGKKYIPFFLPDVVWEAEPAAGSGEKRTAGVEGRARRGGGRRRPGDTRRLRGGAATQEQGGARGTTTRPWVW